MTIDSALLKYEGYKSKLFEDVFRVAAHEYIRMALKYKLVDRQELLEETYQMLYIEYREQLLEEAIERGDHLMYGLSQTDFIVKFYEHSSSDIAMNPYIRQQEFREAFESFLEVNRIFTHLYNHQDHSPLQEVW